MQTTGSRTLFGMRVTAVRLLAVASMLLLGMVGVFAALGTNQAQAGNADAILTVNATANTDDGACGGFPNTTNTTGNCTLHEAIDGVNAGVADTIKFHPAVFSVATPGVIDIEGGLGCLPAIERPVTIDSTNTGVVIDGDNSLDTLSPIFCDAAIHVHANANGYDFSILGGKHFTIRDVGGDALNIDGDDNCVTGTCSLGDVTISGLITRNITDDGIELRDTTNLTNITVTNNDIVATYPVPLFGGPFGDTGVEMGTDGTDLTDNNVSVTGNRITGEDQGVDIDFFGDLSSVITANINDNQAIIGLEDQAAEVDYCDSSSCDAGGDGNTINFNVNNNDSLQGASDGVAIQINADATPATATDSGVTDVNVNVNGNGLSDADTGSGVDIDVNVCCDSSDSTSDVVVDGNDEIVADDEGVDINVDLGCGDDNVSNVSVSDNNRVSSQNDDGVEIDSFIGEAASGCDFDVPPADPSDDSDGNESTVNVDDNARISGDGDGVNVNSEIGAGAAGDGDDNTSDVSVSGNNNINGSDNGIEVDNDAGSDSGDSSDDNTATTTVNDNGRVEGNDDEGVNVDSDAGTEGGDAAFDDGDDNAARIDITNNTTINGDFDDGVEVDIFAGGATSGSRGNTTLTNITGNGDLIGEADSSGAGIDYDGEVCCVPANTNTLNIKDNTGDIIGRDDKGIEIFMGTSNTPAGAGATHITNILDNAGVIRGEDEDGIEYDAETFCPDPGAGDTCPILHSLNILTIGDGPDTGTAGNNISNSEDEGIDICCGAFDLPGTAGTKSVISNNTVNENRDHGIEIHNSVGLNIEHNTIAMNGDDPAFDRGIEIDCDDFTFPFVFPCNHNKISQNSIFDNIGQGIDLNGDTSPPTATSTHGIGCVPFATGVSPNDCIPYPVITLIASGDKVGGTACADCHIELFLADATPVDQTGPLGRQHGEGKTYLVTGTADADGDFSVILPCGLAAGDITATATDKQKNSSEFSANAPFLGSRTCATDTPTVTATFTVGPPTATATQGPPTATATPAKDCGDVNDDGLVNSVDSLLILQLTAALIDTLDNPASADVNNSGEISSVDAALILQKEAALIPQSALVCAAT